MGTEVTPGTSEPSRQPSLRRRGHGRVGPAMASKVVVAEYSAEGGPEKAFMAPDGHEAGPTDAGEYVIAYCAKHRSRRYPQWSSIPWGSPLKHDSDRVLVLLDGRWNWTRWFG